MRRENQAKAVKKGGSQLPQIDTNLFNQTIIINNPNININYIENQNGSKSKNSKTIVETTMYNQKNESKGFDTWNLNKNLKEFSETRQLGFFKVANNQDKNKHQSPYLITKNKTQDIRHGKNQIHSFREQRTISTIKKQTLTPSSEDSTSKTTFRTKPYVYKKAKNPKDTSSNYMDLYSNEGTNENKRLKDRIKAISERKTCLQVRKNRFQRVSTPESAEQSVKNEEKQKQEENIQASGEVEKKQIRSPRRIIQKSVDKITKSFLKKVDCYFDEIETVDMPSSKIQIYTTTVLKPAQQKNQFEYRSSGFEIEGYDFDFEEDKPRKRPKTPYKRKKMYEEM